MHRVIHHHSASTDADEGLFCRPQPYILPGHLVLFATRHKFEVKKVPGFRPRSVDELYYQDEAGQFTLSMTQGETCNENLIRLLCPDHCCSITIHPSGGRGLTNVTVRHRNPTRDSRVHGDVDH